MEIILAFALAVLVLTAAVSVSGHSAPITRHQYGHSVAEIQARLASEATRTYVPLDRR